MKDTSSAKPPEVPITMGLPNCVLSAKGTTASPVAGSTGNVSSSTHTLHSQAHVTRSGSDVYIALWMPCFEDSIWTRVTASLQLAQGAVVQSQLSSSGGVAALEVKPSLKCCVNKRVHRDEALYRSAPAPVCASQTGKQ